MSRPPRKISARGPNPPQRRRALSGAPGRGQGFRARLTVVQFVTLGAAAYGAVPVPEAADLRGGRGFHRGGTAW